MLLFYTWTHKSKYFLTQSRFSCIPIFHASLKPGFTRSAFFFIIISFIETVLLLILFSPFYAWKTKKIEIKDLLYFCHLCRFPLCVLNCGSNTTSKISFEQNFLLRYFFSKRVHNIYSTNIFFCLFQVILVFIIFSKIWISFFQWGNSEKHVHGL